MENISENLKKLQKALQKWESKRDDLTKAEKEEVENAKATIREKYAKKQGPICQGIGEAREQIEKYCKQIQIFSTFNNKSIGEVLEHLVTIFEGKEYCYQEATYHTTKIEHCVFDRVETKVDETVRIIINVDRKSGSYDSGLTNFRELTSDGHMIVLEESEYRLENNIAFNSTNSRNSDIKSQVDYGKFSYVKEFIDGVINFRINNNNPNISKEQLYELMGQFLADKIDLIEANYQMQLQEQQETYKNQLEESQTKYSNQLKKVMIPTSNQQK